MIGQVPGSVQNLTEESPAATVDVWALLAPVGQEQPGHKGQDRTVVLIKTDNLRVVFRSLTEGKALPVHKADGPITVQVLDGHIEFTAGDRSTQLRKGQLLALRSGVPHSLQALTSSAILITVAAGANRSER